LTAFLAVAGATASLNILETYAASGTRERPLSDIAPEPDFQAVYCSAFNLYND
jgi:hypothetical protein